MKILKAFFFFTSVFLSLMFLSFFLLLLLTKEKTKSLISPVIQTSNPTVEVLSIQNRKLEKGIEDALIGTKGTYSVVVKNMKTNETFSQNPERKYISASLYKLWLLAVVYDQLESKTLKKETILSADISALNEKYDIASESAEQTEGRIELSVEDAAEKMITISDNYSALLLSSKIGVSKMAQFLKEYGLTQSSIGTSTTLPQTTAKDIALYFELLYSNKLISENASKEMKELLKKQRLNDRIPKYLPNSLQVAHKTGELNGVKHDAGIVFTKKGDYLLIVLSESNDPNAAAERIAILSQKVYEAFN